MEERYAGSPKGRSPPASPGGRRCRPGRSRPRTGAYAALKSVRNASTWPRSCSAWRDSSPAAPSTWLAAAPVSPGRLGDAGDVAGDLLRAGGRLLHVAGDLLRRRALLLHRRGDRRGDLVDLGDGRADRADRGHGIAGGALHGGDLGADLLGRLGRLVGQALHLGGHDGEALAGLAGARRLDRGVERQQVGLAGDLVDERWSRRRSSAPRRPAP